MWYKKKVLSSSAKSSVIWSEPYSISSAEPNVRLVTTFEGKVCFFWCWKNYADKAMCPSSPQSLWFHRSYFLSPLFWSLSLDGDYHDVQTTKSMALLKVAKPRKVLSWKTNKITVSQLLLLGLFEILTVNLVWFTAVLNQSIISIIHPRLHMTKFSFTTFASCE